MTPKQCRREESFLYEAKEEETGRRKGEASLNARSLACANLCAGRTLYRLGFPSL